MKRIVAREHGSPDVMKIEEVELGNPAPNQIKVRNHAIGVNYTDVYTRQGNETYMRHKDKGVEAYTPGKEGAGIVLEVGENVENFKPGDRVVYTQSLGAYGEEHIVSANLTMHLPKELSFEKAASITLRGLTAYYLVHYSLIANTSNLSDSGTILIPVVIKGVTHTISFAWSKAKVGKPGGDANMLDWVNDWNTNKTLIGADSVITQKIFAGVKNANGTLTGIALGKFPLSTINTSGTVSSEAINGIYGFKDGYKTFFVDNTGNAQLGRDSQSIKYNVATGKVEFGSDVSLNWVGATYIDKVVEQKIFFIRTSRTIDKNLILSKYLMNIQNLLVGIFGLTGVNIYWSLHLSYLND